MQNRVMTSGVDLLPVPEKMEIVERKKIFAQSAFKILLNRQNGSGVEHRSRNDVHLEAKVDSGIDKQPESHQSRGPESFSSKEHKVEETLRRQDQKSLKRLDRKDNQNSDAQKDLQVELKKLQQLLRELEAESTDESAEPGTLLQLMESIRDIISMLEKACAEEADSKLKSGLAAIARRLKGALAPGSEASLKPGERNFLKGVLAVLKKLGKQLQAAPGKGEKKSAVLDALESLVSESRLDKHSLAAVGGGKGSGNRRVRKSGQNRAVVSSGNSLAKSESPGDWQGAVRQVARGGEGRHLAADHGAKKSFMEGVRSAAKNDSPASADSRKIFSQIVERAKVTHRSGMSEMKLQLKPKALGRVRMKLTLKNGAVTARLTVANSEVREMLAKKLDMLGQELREAGINLKDLDISRYGQGGHYRGDGAPDRGTDPLFGIMGSAASTASQQPGASTAQVHAGDVDILA